MKEGNISKWLLFLAIVSFFVDSYANDINDAMNKTSREMSYSVKYGQHILIDEHQDFENQIENKNNSVFEIRHVLDLKNKTIKLPKECLLLFRGGFFINGTIIGNNTIIEAPNYQLFEPSCCVKGTFANAHLYADWFGDLQMAVNLASENSGVLFLSAKVYNLSKSLNIKRGVSLIGCGNEAAFRENRGTIICYEGNDPVIILNGTTQNPAKNITIRNLKIRGNGEDFHSGTNVGLYVGPKSYYCMVENVSIYACSNGVELDNAWNLRFESVNPYYCNNGFYLNGSSRAPLTASLFSTCVAYNCNVGFNFAGDMNATSIESCATDGCATSMRLGGCFGVTVCSYEFERHSKYGVHIDSSDCYATFIGVCPRSPSSDDVTHIKIDKAGRVSFLDLFISESVLSTRGYSIDVDVDCITKTHFYNCNINGRCVNLDKCFIMK